MKIHEYQAAQFLAQYQIPVPDGEVVTTLAEAQTVAKNLSFPVVLKAQVLVGGRGKAGGIKVVRNENELKQNFETLKSITIKDYPVEKVFIVKALSITKEFYLAVTVDYTQGDMVVIGSSDGGVDIEETAEVRPDAIKKLYLNGQQQTNVEEKEQFLKAIFQDDMIRKQASQVLDGMLRLAYEKDCQLVEINPLIIDDKGQLIAADAKINFDDNAASRHEEWETLRDLSYEVPEELDAKNNNISFVKLDGNVGCIVNGAGLAMATMDIIKISGGEPANFLDVGGSSNPQKVLHALRILLQDKNIKAILINIFGGITRCDDIANGIIKAKAELNISVPIVVRLTGTNEEPAKELLLKYHMETYPTMREAVDKVVALAKK